MERIRRRSRYTRARAKRTRPKTPAPTAGWLIRELSQLTEVSVRTLRSYVTQGLLTPTELRGTATRYQRRELLRLLLVLWSRKETKLTLGEVKRRLDEMDESQMEARVRTRAWPAAVAVALGIPSEPAAPEQESAPGTTLERWSAQVQAWRRVQLLPGLELLLGPDASPAAVRAASKICSEYLG